MAIPGTIGIIPRFQSDARYILVIEKDAVYQHLCEEK